MNDQALYDRLVARSVVSDTGCWNWTGAVRGRKAGTNTARGQIRANGTSWQTHRAMWHAFRGPIPDGLLVCHSCDNPLCLNPEHLWLGTNLQNMQDCVRKGRHYMSTVTHCAKGHLLAGDNLIQSLLVGKSPQRRCKICREEYDRRTYVPSASKPWLPKEVRDARNAAIVADHKAGMSLEAMAEKHSVSKSRCFQIYKAAERSAKRGEKS